jgi:carbon-monoxide dehydrogenase medium subunit
MKPVSFEMETPADLAGAAEMMRRDGARAMAGGQSLGPMLNLRLAAPSLLVPIGRLAGLQGAEETAETVTLGACVTHAAVADGRTPDIGGGVLAGIADRIAYRAVRNRGTIGGSLCHADPAADWPTTLLALDAVALTQRGRAIPLDRFIVGPFQTALDPGELLRAVRVPKFSASMRWGYFKACRKPGEFAHAMAAVRRDTASGACRLVVGATGTRPMLFDGAAAAAAWLAGSGLDPVAVHMQTAAIRRALAMAAG